MVAIEREQFGDYGNIIRPKLRTQQFTGHKTESKHYTVDFYMHFTCTVLFAAFVDNKI
jgi:hypothetical protein